MSNLGHVDLNLLPVLNALLRERNLTKAGQQLGLSQPAVSNALSRLRIVFGDELLIRDGRKYRLSRLAAELVEPVEEVLRLVDQTMAKRQSFDPQRDRRYFRIAATDQAAFLVLMPFVQSLETNAPNIAITVREYANDSSPEQLARGELDLIITGRDPAPDLSKQPLYEDRWICVAWKGWTDLNLEPSAAQLKSMRRVSYFWNINNLIPDLPWTDPESTFVVIENHLLSLFMLRNTTSIAMTSERIFSRLEHLLELQVLKPKFELPPTRQNMYWKQSNTEESAHAWLRTRLSKIASNL